MTSTLGTDRGFATRIGSVMDRVGRLESKLQIVELVFEDVEVGSARADHNTANCDQPMREFEGSVMAGENTELVPEDLFAFPNFTVSKTKAENMARAQALDTELKWTI